MPCPYVCIYIYIYIYREREREIDVYALTYVSPIPRLAESRVAEGAREISVDDLATTLQAYHTYYTYYTYHTYLHTNIAKLATFSAASLCH